MAINQVYDDKRTVTGKSSMLLYRDPMDEEYDGKYSILIPLTTVPFVAGSVDTVEYSFTTSETKGKLETGTTLDEKDTEFMLHRDNLMRLEALQGKVLDFLVVNGDFSGRGFVATINVRFNDQTRDEVATGTFTIVPKSADTSSILDCRPLIKETVYFTNSIPDLVVSTSGATTINVPVSVSKSGATITPTIASRINPSTGEYENNTGYTATYDDDNGQPKVVITKGVGTTTPYGIVYIKAHDSNDPKTFASWTTSVAFEFVE